MSTIHNQLVTDEEGSRSGLEPERERPIYLPRNPDPGFTPGSTPGSGSNSVAVSSNKNT